MRPSFGSGAFVFPGLVVGSLCIRRVAFVGGAPPSPWGPARLATWPRHVPCPMSRAPGGTRPTATRATSRPDQSPDHLCVLTVQPAASCLDRPAAAHPLVSDPSERSSSAVRPSLTLFQRQTPLPTSNPLSYVPTPLFAPNASLFQRQPLSSALTPPSSSVSIPLPTSDPFLRADPSLFQRQTSLPVPPLPRQTPLLAPRRAKLSHFWWV